MVRSLSFERFVLAGPRRSGWRPTGVLRAVFAAAMTRNRPSFANDQSLGFLHV
jgi:hypothetical protein